MGAKGFGRGRRLHWLAGAIVLVAIGGILALSLGSSGEDPAVSARPLAPREQEAARVDQRSAAKPGDRKLQIAAMKAWIEVGGARLTKTNVEIEPIPVAVREDLEAGVRIWDRRLAQAANRLDTVTLELAGEVSFELAEIGSLDPADLEADVARSAKALEIAGKRRHTLYTLSNVAVFAYFNGEFARGNVAAKGAASGFKKASQRAIVFEQLDASREHAEVFRRLLRQANAELAESGDELLEKPLRLYSGQTGINKEEPRQ